MSTISTVLTTFPGRKPGDGICLFFWDANYEFYPAGIGSSLGYCNFNGPLAHNAHITGTASAADVNPVRGGYVGIGFDVKGDFSTTNNSKTVKNANILDMESQLSDKLGMRVNLTNKKNNSGRLSFEYRGIDQLNRLVDIIKKNY